MSLTFKPAAEASAASLVPTPEQTAYSQKWLADLRKTIDQSWVKGDLRVQEFYNKKLMLPDVMEDTIRSLHACGYQAEEGAMVYGDGGYVVISYHHKHPGPAPSKKV